MFCSLESLQSFYSLDCSFNATINEECDITYFCQLEDIVPQECSKFLKEIRDDMKRLHHIRMGRGGGGGGLEWDPDGSFKRLPNIHAYICVWPQATCIVFKRIIISPSSMVLRQKMGRSGKLTMRSC